MTQQVVEMAIRELGTLCISWVADGIRKTVKPLPPRDTAAPLSPLGLPDEHVTGCPVCAVHREAAEANALVSGLAERAAATGEIPAGLGGTIPIARKCLDDARGNLSDVAESFPLLRPEIERCDRELATARRSLDGASLSAAEITGASKRTADAWAACYDLAEAAFKPHEQHDPLIGWIDDVKAHPEMSNDEAVRRLKGVLDGGDTNGGRGGDAARDVRGAEPSRRCP